MYDWFITKKHPKYIQSILARSNKNILEHLLTFFKANQTLSILEIGPGKGYFYQATRRFRSRIAYHAFDRNKVMLKNLGISKIYHGEASKLVHFKKKFHIIYAAYVIEHLKDGIAVFEMIKNCKKYLHKDGIIVFIAPNTITQGMEFWNSDYTHTYPTTKRNVSMAFHDNGITDISIFEFNDMALWLTGDSGLWIWIVRVCQILFFFYNYRITHMIFSFIYTKKEYDLDSALFRLYLFSKAQNLMFIARP